MAYNANMNVADIRAGLLAGDFTAREVAEASFKRIEELDGEVHAFLELTKDAAFEQAAKIDEALANGTFDEMGPLAGVPVAFKDNMNYERTHTTCSSACSRITSRLIRRRALPKLLRQAAFRWASSTWTNLPSVLPRKLRHSVAPSTLGIWSVYLAALLAALLLRWLPVLQRLLWAPTRVALSVSLVASAARLP